VSGPRTVLLTRRSGGVDRRIDAGYGDRLVTTPPFRFCPLKKRISAPRGRHIDEMRLELCDAAGPRRRHRWGARSGKSEVDDDDFAAEVTRHANAMLRGVAPPARTPRKKAPRRSVATTTDYSQDPDLQEIPF